MPSDRGVSVSSYRDTIDGFDARWCRLNDWLVRHRAFWQSVPFTEPEPAWVSLCPELARLVSGLTEEQCERLEHDSVAFAVLAAEALPSLADYEYLIQVPDLAPDESVVVSETLPEVRAKDMPGRKRLQAGAFTASVSPLSLPVLDWCSGKGHLSRTLAASCSQPVTGFEWNSELVRDGNRMADKYGERVAVRCQDVMATDLSLPEGVHGVALHACGDLHRQLLRRGAGSRMPRLSFSPCCYHLSADSDYRSISRKAEQHVGRLRVRVADLRLAVQETVTAPARVRAQTRRVSQWRLAFDGLQREIRGVDEYLPVPSYPPRLLQEGFESFCRWAAAKKGISLPDSIDSSRWLAFGMERLQRVRRYELVRHLFRRPLELWMVLDYAVYLEEQGYRVRVGEFCARELTPRNLLIDAEYQGLR